MMQGLRRCLLGVLPGGLLAVASACLLASPLESQIPLLDKVFGNVSSISGVSSWARLIDRGRLAESRVRAMGIEMLLDVGSAWCRNVSDAARQLNQCQRKRDRAVQKGWLLQVCQIRKAAGEDGLTADDEERRLRRRAGQPAALTTPADLARCPAILEGPGTGTATEVERRVRRGRTLTTTTHKPPTPPSDGTSPTLFFEAGLGYSVYTGFESDSGADASHLSGGLTEVPALSAYMTWNAHGPLSVYVGARVGLNQLTNFRAQVRDTTITPDSTIVSPGSILVTPDTAFGRFAVSGSGNGYFAGVAVGVSFNLFSPVSLVGSGGYYRRRIAGIEWKKGSAEFSNPGLPHTLRLSNWEANVGVQIALK